MGVHNLWKILEAVGRRVDLGSLQHKVVAVDASIWLTQFVKAMRSAEGEVVQNAHLLGTFRRVLRLLFNHIRPVFVFDGGTPALKRRTVLLRQQRRSMQESRHALAVRKLLLTQLQKARLQQQLAAAGNDSDDRRAAGAPAATDNTTGGGFQTHSTPLQGAASTNDIDAVGAAMSKLSAAQLLALESAVRTGARAPASPRKRTAAPRARAGGATRADGEARVRTRAHADDVGKPGEQLASDSDASGTHKDEDAQRLDAEELAGRHSPSRRSATKRRRASAAIPVDSDSELDAREPATPAIPSYALAGVEESKGDLDGVVAAHAVMRSGRHSAFGVAAEGVVFTDDDYAATAAFFDESDDDVPIPSRRTSAPVAATSVRVPGAPAEVKVEEEEEAEEDEADAPLVPDDVDAVDLSVVANLPPNMQKEYVEELQRRRRAAARTRLLPVAADPSDFSRQQLACFLGTAKFNAGVDAMNNQQAQSALHGRRIASEANREFVLLRTTDSPASAGARMRAANNAAGERTKGDIVISIAHIKAQAAERAAEAARAAEADSQAGFLHVPTGAAVQPSEAERAVVVPEAAASLLSNWAAGSASAGMSEPSELEKVIMFAQSARYRNRVGGAMRPMSTFAAGATGGASSRGGMRGRGRGGAAVSTRRANQRMLERLRNAVKDADNGLSYAELIRSGGSRVRGGVSVAAQRGALSRHYEGILASGKGVGAQLAAGTHADLLSAVAADGSGSAQDEAGMYEPSGLDDDARAWLDSAFTSHSAPLLAPMGAVSVAAEGSSSRTPAADVMEDGARDSQEDDDAEPDWDAWLGDATDASSAVQQADAQPTKANAIASAIVDVTSSAFHTRLGESHDTAISQRADVDSETGQTDERLASDGDAPVVTSSAHIVELDSSSVDEGSDAGGGWVVDEPNSHQVPGSKAANAADSPPARGPSAWDVYSVMRPQQAAPDVAGQEVAATSKTPPLVLKAESGGSRRPHEQNEQPAQGGSSTADVAKEAASAAVHNVAGPAAATDDAAVEEDSEDDWEDVVVAAAPSASCLSLADVVDEHELRAQAEHMLREIYDSLQQKKAAAACKDSATLPLSVHVPPVIVSAQVAGAPARSSMASPPNSAPSTVSGLSDMFDSAKEDVALGVSISVGAHKAAGSTLAFVPAAVRADAARCSAADALTNEMDVDERGAPHALEGRGTADDGRGFDADMATDTAMQPASHDTEEALAQAYALAGSMRGWAQHAFARAMRNLGVALPNREEEDVARAAAPSAAPIATSGDTHVQAHVRAIAYEPFAQEASTLPADTSSTHVSIPAAAVDLDAEHSLDADDFTALDESMHDASDDAVDESAHDAEQRSQLNAAARTKLLSDLHELEQEEAQLRDVSRTAARDTSGVTDSMQDEVIALLQLFGLPYIVAPMEAEAQCAELQLAGLVDAVVTDDSDAFLFGATTVYRNIFDESKYVEVYEMKDVERELGLTRDDLVRAALLLGSDYTEGISGVGPVNAVEILHAFPGDEGLVAFRDWLHSVEPDELAPASKRGARGKRRTDGDDEGAELETSEAETRVARFKRQHQTGKRKWLVSEGFPSRAVLAAYRKPTVTHLVKGTHKLSFQMPDVPGLRALCTERLGWLPDRVQTELAPVMQRVAAKLAAEGGSGSGSSDAPAALRQSTLESFVLTYSHSQRAALIKSQRLRAAVQGLAGSSNASVLSASTEVAKSGKKRARARVSEAGRHAGDNTTASSTSADAAHETK